MRRWWIALALVVTALFLASVARFYHPGVGFSALLEIPQGHDYEIPALQRLPHFEYGPHDAYDGSMYVQLAMEPLLRDQAIDRAMDAPAYRARRILFCWTAYAMGLGRPAWILQTYALQNVLCWLILAWLMTRWLPLVSARNFALWIGCMLSHGLLMSVRLSLLDGPSTLLLAVAMVAAESGRTVLTGLIVGLAGLGRETNLLGAVGLPLPSRARDVWRLAAAAILIVLPLAIWQDYVWSIYRGTSASAGVDQLTIPFAAFVKKWTVVLRDIRGFHDPAPANLGVVVALTVQAIFLVWYRAFREPWWRMSVAYLALMFAAHWVVWEGSPGAITRVVLPMTFGFNVLLARHPPKHFWWWCALGNLHVVAALHQLPIPGLLPPF
jgi:hypothetical protein